MLSRRALRTATLRVSAPGQPADDGVVRCTSSRRTAQLSANRPSVPRQNCVTCLSIHGSNTVVYGPITAIAKLYEAIAPSAGASQYQPRWTQTAVNGDRLPGWLDARHRKLAGGCSEGVNFCRFGGKPR